MPNTEPLEMSLFTTLLPPSQPSEYHLSSAYAAQHTTSSRELSTLAHTVSWCLRSTTPRRQQRLLLLHASLLKVCAVKAQHFPPSAMASPHPNT